MTTLLIVLPYVLVLVLLWVLLAGQPMAMQGQQYVISGQAGRIETQATQIALLKTPVKKP